MLHRGYEVTACDISPAMVARAREAAEDQADPRIRCARVARARAIRPRDEHRRCPQLPAERRRACSGVRGVARNLRPGGIFAFDLNTLGGYKRNFHRRLWGDLTARSSAGGGSVRSRRPGETFTSVVEVFTTDEESAGVGTPARTSSVTTLPNWSSACSRGRARARRDLWASSKAAASSDVRTSSHTRRSTTSRAGTRAVARETLKPNCRRG